MDTLSEEKSRRSEFSRLDLKYRPRRFADVLGNEGVVRLLLKRSATGTLTDQSMLFGGPKGTGKTTLARIVALAIVCQDKQAGEPCGKCPACLGVLHETSDSVEELDAASQGTIDKIRGMVHDSEYECFGGVGNLYILDEAQRLSPAAQDAMLKAIEDRSIIVMMCTTEPHKIRDPIRSRVEEYPISAPKPEALEQRLQYICEQEGIGHESGALKLLVKAGQNCPRVCIRALGTLSLDGSISTSSVKEFFRFDSYETVNKVLASIDEHPHVAVSEFDGLIDKEGPAWVRDAMVFAVSAGLRADIGIKHSYPASVSFFQTRLGAWSEFAKQIGSVERPTPSGILAALLSTRPGFSRPVQTPQPSPPPVRTSAILEPVRLNIAPTAVKPEAITKQVDTGKEATKIEIDGVAFSSNEYLTSLDMKIRLEQQKSKETPQTEEQEINVQYSSDMVPMTDREFAREFTRRIKAK